MDRLSGILIAVMALALPSAFLLVMGSRRFRALVAKVILVFAVIAIGIYLYAAKQDKLVRSRIPPSQLALQHLSLESQFGNYLLRGRVKNNSKSFSLKCMTLEITARDCPREAKTHDCKVIGDDKENVCVEIAPGKSGDFDTYVNFPGGALNPHGKLAWDYRVFETYSD
jgi:hypothetical protein